MHKGVNGGIIGGDSKVLITNNSFHSPETWGEIGAGRIISIGPDIPEPARQQAIAFKEQIAAAVAEVVRQARAEMLHTIAADLDKEGQTIAAEVVRRRVRWR